MLHFVTGIAGTGKTGYLTEKMRCAAESAGRLIYLVPEQYSFEAERQMYRKLGGELALKVEVLSFTRLCDSVFRAYGGLAGIPLTKTARYLLMSIAAQETRDSLSLYRKSCGKIAFLKTLVDTCGEFKAAGITCGALSGFAKTCGDEALRRKLSELALIYTAYQGLIERGYNDPDDALIRACALLENNMFFKDAAVFVDGFTTFMAAEFELLGHAIAQADDIYFAVTADGVFDDQRGTGMFSAAKSAMNRLSRLAASSGTEIAEPVILAGPRRFLRPELAYLSEVFGRPAIRDYNGEYTGAVEISAAPDIYGELDMVAASIARLTREENCRYNEIAVVARDTGPYARAAEAAFSLHGIPYFMSVPEDLENTPIIRLVTAALDAVRSGFGADETLLYAKSPLLGLDPGEVALLENYCYCWGIRGALWQEDFKNNPRGLRGIPSEEDVDVLRRVNAVREAVIAPLLNLRDSLRQSQGQSFAKGIFGLLEETRAAENLIRYAENFQGDVVSSASRGQSSAFLDGAAQIWDTLMDILDVFGEVLGGYRMSAASLCELFRLAVNSAEISSPPQTLDQVLVGDADRIRPEKLRAVFVIGANEDVFPARITGSGVFSDTERGALIDAGLEISAPSLQRSALEKYFAYFALTLPSEWLRVSFSRSDLKGRELLPSSIILRLGEIFPELPEPERDILPGISTANSAFAVLAKNYGEDKPLTATLMDFFSRDEYAGTLSRMRRAAERGPHKIADVSAARELFGRFMRLSPSRVERFYKCHFAYFVSDGLKIHARHKVEFTGLESGDLIHHVLQAVVQKHGGKGLAELSDKELSDELEFVIREYLAGLIGDAGQLPARLRYLFGRLKGTLARLLRRLGEEFTQSGFEPVGFELPIREGGAVRPLRLETPDGMSVVVEGVVDRVDVMNKNGKRYVRVVDYKSGIKNFELRDVMYGLNMQMLLYLFTIAENGRDKLADAVPAGVLYMPARERYVSAERDSDAESMRKAHQKEWRMSGLLLDDEEVLRGMERGLEGLYIPAKLDKNGRIDTSSLVSGAELGRLARKVREQVAGMARLLGQGAIEACPIEENGVRACEHCDYGAICGFEQGDAARGLSKLSREEIFKILREEEQDAESLD